MAESLQAHCGDYDTENHQGEKFGGMTLPGTEEPGSNGELQLSKVLKSLDIGIIQVKLKLHSSFIHW